MSEWLTQLPAAGALDGTEPVYVVQSGNSRQSTVNAILALALGGGPTAELIRDTIAAAMVEFTGLNIDVNDALDTITLNVILASVAEIRAGTEAAKAIAPDTLIASAAFQTLTDAATVAWDMAAGYNAKVTLGGNRTLGTPTNPKEGITYSLQVVQDGTGSRTLGYPASVSFGSAGAPTLSTTAAKVDMIYLQCLDAATPTFRATFNKSA